MDAKNRKILEAIEKDARSSTREISKKTHLPITTVHHRLKRLEKEKVIRGYYTDIDYAKCGKPILAYIFLTVDYTKFKAMTQAQIKEKIVRVASPLESYIITGTFDIMVKMCFENTNKISTAIEALRKIEGVDKTQTMIVIE